MRTNDCPGAPQYRWLRCRATEGAASAVVSDQEGIVMAKERRAGPSVRIMTQFRDGRSMVYDFSCDAERLIVEIAPSETSIGAFTAAARTRAAGPHTRAAVEPSLAEAGPTRGEALRAVGRAWASKNGALGFPTIDWELVSQALVAVRAIEAAPTSQGQGA